MAGEVVFKSHSTPVSTPEGGTNVKTGKRQEVSTSNIEVPYLDYEREHGSPYSVEHFALGDTWSNRDGGFPAEVGIIEEYFKSKITGGDMANSVSAVKDRIKEILKVTNTRDEERQVVKIGTISAYIKFLMESDKINYDARKYAKERYSS